MNYPKQPSFEKLGRRSMNRLYDAKPLLSAILLIALAACSNNRPLDDEQKMVRSVLTLLTSEGRKICLNDQTEGEALSIFREMAIAPLPSRDRLRWSYPEPLWPSAVNLEKGKVDKGETRIAPVLTEPSDSRRMLPAMDQYLLNSAALRLSTLKKAGEPVAISSAWTPKGVAARWWPLNSFKECDPLFAVTKPVRDRTIGFVTVRSAHWGTIYALKPVKGEWVVSAEWSRWLE